MNKLHAFLIAGAVGIIAATLTTVMVHGSWFSIPLMLAFLAATLTTALLLVSVDQAETAPKTSERQKAKQSVSRQSAGSAHAASGDSVDGPRSEGVVKWFNGSKGYGFITTDSGDEIFAHYRAMQGGNRRSLRQGQRVSFGITESDKGPQAENIEVIN